MRAFYYITFAIAFLFACEVGHLLSLQDGQFATFWPPSGLFLASLLRFPRRHWPYLLGSGFAANAVSNLVIHGQLPIPGFGFAFVNAIAALAGAFLVERLSGGRYLHDSLRHVLILFLIAAPVIAILGGVLGALIVHLAFGTPIVSAFSLWWVADMVGLALVTPLLLVPLPDLKQQSLRSIGETVALLCLLAFTSLMIFSARSDTLYATTFPICPLILWAALRFHLVGVSLACLLQALIALPFAIGGFGPFAIAGCSPGKQIIALQVYLYVCSLTFQIVAAIVVERARNERLLSETADTLRHSLREKETLLKEVHHRVKNNLAVIGELLTLQANRAADSGALPHLVESRDRVWSLAAVHEMLYRSRELSRIDLPDYVHQVCQHLLASYLVEPGRVRLETAIDPLTLELEQAMPFGLLLNELVSNALKHGFPDKATGCVRVELARAPSTGESHATLVVRDDGVGLPPDLGVRRAQSLGLLLIDSLSRQLHGTPEFAGAGGTQFRLQFPLRAEASRSIPPPQHSFGGPA